MPRFRGAVRDDLGPHTRRDKEIRDSHSTGGGGAAPASETS
jgi:hypothetical protein